MIKKYIDNKGFTLLELIIAIAIFCTIIFLTVLIVQQVLIGSQEGFTAVGNVDNARTAAFRFINEVRNATTGVDGSYALNVASNNQVIFYSKSAAAGSPIDRINYYLSGTTLYKGVTAPTGQTYNLANEVENIVQNNVVNPSNNPIFTYYDGNYNGSTNALAQPVNVTTVRYIKINLVILNEIQGTSQANFLITAGATIRNVKTNLGS